MSKLLVKLVVIISLSALVAGSSAVKAMEISKRHLPHQQSHSCSQHH